MESICPDETLYMYRMVGICIFCVCSNLDTFWLDVAHSISSLAVNLGNKLNGHRKSRILHTRMLDTKRKLSMLNLKLFRLTHLCRVKTSTSVLWTGPFPI